MAKQLYEDGTIITQAFRFNSAGVTTPIDVRLVATGPEALYISASNPTNAVLYGRAYRGMPIAIVDENVGTAEANDVKIYVLKNELPYKFGSPGTVNADNFSIYWTEVGKSLNDEITEEIQPTIDCLTRYVKAENVSAGKGITVDTSAYSITKDGITVNDALSYKVEVVPDGSTVSFDANDKLTTGLYRVASQGSGSATTYRLQFKAANGTEYTDIANSSTIEVHFEDWALNSRVDEVSTYAINVSDNLATLNSSVLDISTKKIPNLVSNLLDVSTVANNAKTQAATNAASIAALDTSLTKTIEDLLDVSTQVEVLDTCVGDVYKFADDNEKVIAAALTDMDLRLVGFNMASLFDDAQNTSVTFDKRDADDMKYGRVFVKTGSTTDPAAPRADVMRMINKTANATDQYVYYYDDYTVASGKVTIQRNIITGVLIDSSVVENVVR